MKYISDVVPSKLLSIGSYMYHLRVYVYQARNLTSMDKDSFSGKILVVKNIFHWFYTLVKNEHHCKDTSLFFFLIS